MSITLASHSRMRGMFQIERQQHNPDGSPIPGTKEVVAPWQDNLLTDSGLDNLAQSNFMGWCGIGAGSSAPDEGDEQLVSQLARVSGSVTSGPAGDGYNSVVGTYLFPPGTGTGIISEICVAPSASANITTRSLIKDEGGNPTTITKGPIDSLTVTYQIREYPDQTDTVSVVTNPHTSQAYTVVQRGIGGAASLRLLRWHDRGPIGSGANGGNYPAVSNSPLIAWDAPYSGPSGSGVYRPVSNNDVAPYTSGNYYRDVSATWGEGQGNVPSGITRVELGNTGTGIGSQPFFLQASFDPPIDKDNTKVLTLTLRKSWGRYAP